MSEQSTQVRDPFTPAGELSYGNPGNTGLDLISTGPKPTDVIPRVWAEAMLALLRSEKPQIWKNLIGRVSAGE